MNWITKRKRTALLILFIIILPLILGFTDYYRANQNRPPLFCVKIAVVSDGGSSVFLGLGYTIWFWHKLILAPDAEQRGLILGYKVGPRLTFWFQLGRENTWFEYK